MNIRGKTVPNLYFLKLGGSLITDKNTPRSPRLNLIADLAQEICTLKKENPDLKFILGHGSGSFGHIPAKEFDTREGVTSLVEWQGFATVWWEAASLNHILLGALHQVNLPAISFPVSAAAITRDREVIAWNPDPIAAALRNGLLPVVFGDVVFDTFQGGTILSTEDIFSHLARIFCPQKILLAGIEDGVWADYPTCTRLVPEITIKNSRQYLASLAGSGAPDVTGGMASKVQDMLDLVTSVPGLEIHIFSGNPPENIHRVIQGVPLGTRITA